MNREALIKLCMSRGAYIQVYQHIFENEPLNQGFIEYTLFDTLDIEESLKYTLKFTKASSLPNYRLSKFFTEAATICFRRTLRLYRKDKSVSLTGLSKDDLSYLAKWLYILNNILNKKGVKQFIRLVNCLPAPLKNN